MSITIRETNGYDHEYQSLYEAFDGEYHEAMLSNFMDKDYGFCEFTIYDCNFISPNVKGIISLAEARGLLLSALTEETSLGESDSDIFYAFCRKEGKPISVPKRLQKKYPSIY